jgi:putative flippase GtrA
LFSCVGALTRWRVGALCDPHFVTRYRRLGTWFVIGATAALLELALLRVLFELLGWPLPVATAIAAEVLILGKFVTTDRLVFGHALPTVNRLLRYHGASAGALLVYWLVINGLAELRGVPYVAAFIVGTAAAFAWSLVTNFLWVWAQPARS